MNGFNTYSSFLSTVITVFGSLMGVYLTWYLSTRKSRRAAREKHTRVDYSSYEAILKDLNHVNDIKNQEINRLLEDQRNRETLITYLRKENDAHYVTEEKLKQEIDRLKHLHDYQSFANKISD